MGDLSWQTPYFCRTEHLNAWHHAVVLVVVGYDDAAFLFLGQDKLHIVLDVCPCLNEGGINILACEVDDHEAVLQVADDVGNFLVCPFLLIGGDELRHAERRDIEPFASQRIEVVQAVGIFLESGVAAISAYKYVGVHEYVVRVETLFCHGSECQMREHFLFVISQGVNPTGHPDSDEGVNELLTGQSVLLQEQFEYALALLLNLFVSFAHNDSYLMITAAKLRIYFQLSRTCPLLFDIY